MISPFSQFSKILYFLINLDEWYLTSYESPFFMILFFISFFFVISAILAGIILFIRRKPDLFAHQNRTHYKKAEGLAKNYFFTENHRNDFFGRMTVVMTVTGPYSCCLITPYELFDEDSQKRYHLFRKLTEEHKELNVAPSLWVHENQPLMIVYDKLVSSAGKILPTLSSYHSNKKLGRKDKENILLTLAKTLSGLHKLKTKSGEKLYHGFLLPRSFYLATDSYYAIKRFILADAGMAFALGPKKVYQRIEDLKKGNVLIEKNCSHEIISNLSLLAPEQKDPRRLHEVSFASDFYTFAAVAVTLFTGRKFSKPSEVDWLQVPEKWRSFLFSCMEDKVENRPNEFLDIENWLTDQELSLSFYKNSLNRARDIEEKEIQKQENLTALTLLLKCLKQAQVIPPSNAKLSEELQKRLNHYLSEGLRAVAMSQWSEAKKHFHLVLKLCPNHTQAHANLAIIYYELNDLKAAEEHYGAIEEVLK